LALSDVALGAAFPFAFGCVCICEASDVVRQPGGGSGGSWAQGEGCWAGGCWRELC